MNTKTALLIIAVLLLVGLLLFFWYSNARIQRRLILAEQETALAQEKLTQAGEVVQVKSLELAQVQAESQAVIEKTEAKITKLKQEASVSLERVGHLTVDNQALKEHIGQLVNAEIELIPQPMKEVLTEGVNLYPKRDFSEAEIQANESGLALFQLVISEVRDRRALDLNNEEIINENRDQAVRLATVIREQETKFLAMGKSYQEQGQYVSLLEAENITCKEWGQSLQAQVGLYKKKTSFEWLKKTGMVAAIAGAFYLGSQMP